MWSSNRVDEREMPNRDCKLQTKPIKQHDAMNSKLMTQNMLYIKFNGSHFSNKVQRGSENGVIEVILTGTKTVAVPVQYYKSSLR